MHILFVWKHIVQDIDECQYNTFRNSGALKLSRTEYPVSSIYKIRPIKQKFILIQACNLVLRLCVFCHCFTMGLLWSHWQIQE